MAKTYGKNLWQKPIAKLIADSAIHLP